MWRILRAHTVAIVAPDVDPTDTETANAVCDPHDRTIQAHHTMLMLCLDQGIAAHLSGLQEALHSRTAMDDDLVDDAVAAVAGWAGDDGDPVDM